MSRRSPARFLAPLALIAVAIALVAVLSGGSASTEREAAPAPAGTATSDKSAKAKKKTSGGRRTYTVKPGDTPSGIAEKTGVTVEKLLDLNPDLDPQSLVPGTRLKLR
ncbi:MAG TPA: LysM domain-containing protein [Solirubrobacteraceae bacterium]|jgi:LysM repeat protein